MDRLSGYWHSLSPQDQTAIIIGVVVTVVGGLILAVLAILGKLSFAGLKRLFGKSPTVQPPQPPPLPITIRLETPHLISPDQSSQQAISEPKKSTASPEIPRTPAVAFVARRDKNGRDILTQLKEKLEPENHQLIVLWGPGGVGKTRLASEVAHALMKAFANRIVWVSADGRPEFGLSTLLDGIATQLDRAELHQLAPDPKKAEVRELIASAPPLVVLDNFETIASPEQERCTSFLAHEASCPALITTRGMIASNFAQNIPIDAMSQDEAQIFLDELLAQAPDTEAFTETNRQRIIDMSAANPLVMQWVVQQIVLSQEPEAILDKLAHGEGDAAERVFDMSFELPFVGDDGRAALLALSLFPSEASRPSLSEVAGFGDDVARLNLAAKSLGALRLIRTTEGGKRLLVEGLTRQLAKARLSKDEHAGEFAKRFVIHFRSFAESHAETTSEDFDALETEKESVLSAIDLALQIGDWTSVMETRSALEEFLDLHGYWEDSIRSGKQALKAARALKSELSIAQFAHNLGVLHQGRGDLDEARRLYHESLEISRKLGNQGGIAVSLHELGRLAQGQGELDEARRLYDESLEMEKSLGNQDGIASSLHNLASLSRGQGDIDEARRLYSESLEISKSLGNQGGIASSLHQLAMLAQDRGEFDEARPLYNQCLEIDKRFGNQNGIALTLGQLGNLAEDEGNNTEAAQLFAEALAIFEKLKSPNAERARASLERVKGKVS